MRRLSALAIVSVLAVTGCPRTPTVEVYSVRVQSVSPLGVGMMMTLEVHNDNAYDVQIRAVRAKIVLADKYVMPPVVYNPNTWLAAGRSTAVRIPVTVPWATVPRLLAATAKSTEIEYRVTGLADVTAVRMLGIRVNNHEIDEEGTMSRAELVQAALRGVGGPLPGGLLSR